MAIPTNISIEDIKKAIAAIDPEKIPTKRLDHHYIIIENSKVLPIKYVISIANKFANGNELGSGSFTAIEAKAFLTKNKFKVIDKRIEQLPVFKNVWIEKTLVKGRKDRIEGNRALGKALWSPQKGKPNKKTGKQADVYKNMLLVKPGDIIIHLIDNEKIVGVSLAKNSAIETIGLIGTEWEDSAYLIELINYTELQPPIYRTDLLTEENKSILLKIASKSTVFYNKKLDLRQGAYLTPCSLELLSLINKIYHNYSNKDLPYFSGVVQDDLEIEVPGFLFEVKVLIDKLLNSGLQFKSQIVTRFACSLLTKPFAILTGLSGSGKTKLAQAFAIWICEDPNQYRIVPVGADWTNREPLLGFPNALTKEEYIKPDNRVLDLLIDAEADPKKPYFLILDEMNLSHVERYFADFLSGMESNSNISLHTGTESWNGVPSQIKIPKNLFIIGTVNIDETTYMFSPKVLDRASVIEFRVTSEEIENYLDGKIMLRLENLKSAGRDMAKSFVAIGNEENLVSKDAVEIRDALMVFFKELKKTGAEFGYRSASEIRRFAAVVNAIEPSWTFTEIMDAAIMQKLLPKVHGSRKKLEGILLTLARMCTQKSVLEGKDFKIESLLNSEQLEIETEKFIYPVSFEKISRMYKGLLANGFTSYAEA